jgi:hypothetical protein
MNAPREPWKPRVEEQQEFNPFSPPGDDRDALLHSPKINDASQDTSPLQGSKDLSDPDSLDDVIADANESGVAAETGSRPTTAKP